jgi:ribose-phosphate pyrophosphokinase
MNSINLTLGLSDNNEYKAFKFPGGELHILLKDNIDPTQPVQINTRINSSDDLMLFIITVEMLKKDYNNVQINAFIPYMPYQQADRDFGLGECFSLKTVTKLLNSLDVNQYTVFDPHSEVTPALLKNIKVIDNSDFIKWVTREMPEGQTVWLSPDAGAYKKINKLAHKIFWQGNVAAANKYRNTSTGNIDSLELSVQDFEGKDVLIIDDICMGGRTFIELAKKLKERNVGKLFLAVSHMVSDRPNEQLNDYFDKVYITNSRHQIYYPSLRNLEIFNII